MLHFPGVSEEDFDFEAEWLVRAIDDVQKKILFSGQGRNGDLELELNFQDNIKQFEHFFGWRIDSFIKRNFYCF